MKLYLVHFGRPQALNDMFASMFSHSRVSHVFIVAETYNEVIKKAVAHLEKLDGKKSVIGEDGSLQLQEDFTKQISKIELISDAIII